MKLKISLLICTYQRPESVIRLMESVSEQTNYPDQILIIDGSHDDETLVRFRESEYINTKYHKVPASERGLTRQRNFGIQRVSNESDIVAFLDDDTIIQQSYFEELVNAFVELPDASGIGGIAINENRWIIPESGKKYALSHYYQLDGHVVKLSSRNVLRQKLGLGSQLPSGILPEFSNGNTFSYPLTGKCYPVDLLIGMSMSFRKKVIDQESFSTFFEGYGLYEDTDYSIKSLKHGQNYIATSVQLEHHHHPDGRPIKFAYGKMVVRNGWFVWRKKYPQPSLKNTCKWYAIMILLALIRFLNTFTTTEREQAFSEFCGRVVGLASLVWNKPQG